MTKIELDGAEIRDLGILETKMGYVYSDATHRGMFWARKIESILKRINKKIRESKKRKPMMNANLSEESAKFLIGLAEALKTQDNAATRSPYYYTVKGTVHQPVPEGYGDKKMWYLPDLSDSTGPMTDEELEEYARDNEFDLEELKHDSDLLDTVEAEETTNVFLTETACREFMKRDAHNLNRRFLKHWLYVKYAYKNPEMEKLLEVVQELSDSLLKQKGNS